jgi:hypothetical protein
MAQRKIQIGINEAVSDIRGGLDDVALMKKYACSAANLESLFRKLVQKGALSEQELDQRTRVSQRSHVVTFDGFPDSEVRKANVKASDALNAIRSGMSDLAIMNDYNLSVKGLDSLYSKLVAMGKLDQAEVDARRGTLDQEVWLSSGRVSELSRTGDCEYVSYASCGAHDTFWEAHKTLITAGIGFSIGMAVFAVLVIAGKVPGDISGIVWKWASSVTVQGPKPPDAAVSQTSSSGIVGEQQATEALASSSRDECFRNCEKAFPTTDDAEQTFLTDCKRDCIAVHSIHMRRIRDRFFGNAKKIE